MILVDASGNVLASTNSAPSGLSALIDQFPIPAAGTYYVKLTGASAASYTLSLQTNTAIDTEPNNSLAGAQDITPSGAAVGSISTGASAENDFAIALPAGAILTLQTATPAGGPDEYTNNLNPMLELFDPAGKLIATDDNSAPDGRNAVLVRRIPASGRYVVRVTGGAGTSAVGDYVLSSSFLQLLGDLNADGIVDTADFAILYRNIDKTAKGYLDGDLNGDGKVSFADFQIFELAFGNQRQPPPPLPVMIAAASKPAREKTPLFSSAPIKLLSPPKTPLKKPKFRTLR